VTGLLVVGQMRPGWLPGGTSGPRGSGMSSRDGTILAQLDRLHRREPVQLGWPQSHSAILRASSFAPIRPWTESLELGLFSLRRFALPHSICAARILLPVGGPARRLR
jgi:hypothetical protein